VSPRAGAAVTASPEVLTRLRDEVERIDAALVALIAERVELARGVGEVKRALGLPTLDPSREAAVIRRAGELARGAGVDPEEVRGLFWCLVGLSRRAQEEAR